MTGHFRTPQKRDQGGEGWFCGQNVPNTCNWSIQTGNSPTIQYHIRTKKSKHHAWGRMKNIIINWQPAERLFPLFMFPPSDVDLEQDSLFSPFTVPPRPPQGEGGRTVVAVVVGTRIFCCKPPVFRTLRLLTLRSPFFLPRPRKLLFENQSLSPQQRRGKTEREGQRGPRPHS